MVKLEESEDPDQDPGHVSCPLGPRVSDEIYVFKTTLVSFGQLNEQLLRFIEESPSSEKPPPIRTQQRCGCPPRPSLGPSLSRDHQPPTSRRRGRPWRPPESFRRPTTPAGGAPTAESARQQEQRRELIGPPPGFRFRGFQSPPTRWRHRPRVQSPNPTDPPACRRHPPPAARRRSQSGCFWT